MKHYFKYILVLSFLLLLIISGSACLGVEEKTQELSDSDSGIVTPTETMIQQDFNLSTSCWDIVQDTSKIAGSFIYKDRNNKQAFAWDISSFITEQITHFPDDAILMHTFRVSPDGSFLAGSNGGKIIFISEKKIKTYQLSEKEQGSPMLEFLEDGKIRIPTSKDQLDSYQEGVGLTDEFYVLDPDTGEITTHLIFLPDFFVDSHNIFAKRYSPDLRYVVYQTGYSNYMPQYILFDLEQNKVLWEGPQNIIDMVGSSDVMPVWIPNSYTLIYPFITDRDKSFGNYYSISLDGEITKKTQFEQTKMLGISMGRTANTPSWSPDGHYLAFKASNEITNSIRLYIWDEASSTAYMPCLPDEDKMDVGYIGTWSYDGTYYLITLCYRNPNMTDTGPMCLGYKTVILDMVNKIIVELPDYNNRGEYTSLYGDGQNEFVGWVDWEVP